MRRSIQNIILVIPTLLLILLLVIRCKQVYDPPAIRNPNQFLVVDGFINTEVNGVTTFNLNRTRGLGDTTNTGIPELRAKMTILSSTGASWPLTDAGGGNYTSAPLSLDIAQKFSLQIVTADGRKYASDVVAAKRTPPIDSVYWQQPANVILYIDTHDPTNVARFYRFDYLETWEHDAEYTSPYTVINGRVVAQLDSVLARNQCWTTHLSSNVMLANSTALSQDIITGFKLNEISIPDERLNIRYSILARQYALTEDAYNYWLLVQKTSDNTGSLFDLQPSQLISNIHCTTNPSEPVIGFLSATSIQQQRIFIDHNAISNWMRTDTMSGCTPKEVAVDPLNPFVYDYPDTAYGPWYFVTGGPLKILPKKCMSCLYQGGTSKKPSFWQ